MREVQKLRDLLERCEKASGPDREIDEALASALSVEEYFGQLADAPAGTGCMMYRTQSFGSMHSAYRVTSSLDAALAVVRETLPRWNRSVDATAPEMGIAVTLYDPGDKDFTGDHLLEPIATIIACLRALISQAEGEVA